MLESLKQKFFPILKKIEKHIGTNMVYLFSGASWITIGNTISSVCSFLLLILFSNVLSKENLGTYQYVLSIASILATPTLAGMNTAITQAVARGFDGTVQEALKIKIRWGLIGTILSVFLAGYYYINDNNTLAISFIITAIFLPFMDSFYVFNSFLEGKKFFKKSSVYAIIIAICKLIILGFTLLITKNIFLILFVYFITTTTLRALFFIITIKNFKSNSEIDYPALSYGKHLSLMRVLGNIASQLDKILIFQFIGAAEVAAYSLALAPITRLTGLITPIITLAFPKFTLQNPDTIKKTLPRKIFYFSLILIIISIVYVLIVPYVFKFIFPTYYESINYTRVLAILIILIPQKLIASVLTAHGKKRPLYIITTISPIIKIALLVLLLPLLGVWGAIISIIIPTLISGFLTTHYFKKI